MYEAIEAYAADFNDLQKVLADPTARERVTAIRTALEQTARRIGETSSDNETDRNSLAKLYRGILAAGRIVAQLQESAAAR
jgi:hypothetical protein